MQLSTREMVGRVNFVLSSRYVKASEAIDEYIPIPQNREEEQEATIELMYRYLKKHFPGCKIRTRTHGFSIRLDGILFKRANKLVEDFYNSQEWRKWFERNHPNTWRVISRNSNTFQSLSKTTKDGKVFLYIPFRLDRIPNYVHHGLNQFLRNVKSEVDRAVELGSQYDSIVSMVEEEVARREQERLEKLERELRSYHEKAKRNLFTHIRSLSDDRSTVSGKLKEKIRAWAEENGKELFFAEEPTFERVVPTGVKVRVINETESKEENWFAFPIFDTDYAVPEGYVLQNGWGVVTKHSTDDARSRNGRAPIVVEHYMYLSYDLEHWKSLLPEGYLELLEATRRFRAEAEAECLEEECREEEIQAEEFQGEEVVEEVVETARADADRVARLAEQLRAQVVEPVVEEGPEEMPFEAAPATPTADFQATVERARSYGIYRNELAIPLERYVLVIDNHVVYRASSLARINTFIDRETDLTSVDELFSTVFDYRNPHHIVERNNP